MALVNSILSWVMKKRIHQINLFVKYPIEVQQEVFRQLLKTASNTEWGKKYHYSEIQSYQQFRERVPISNYDALKPYIDRVIKGEQQVLWPSEIKWFSKSSGTTAGKSKFIPVSQEALEACHFKAGKDMLSLYVNNYENTSLFNGKSLMLAGSKSIHQLNSGAFTGDLSAILVEHLPFWAEFRTTPEPSVALMEDWEEKIDKIVDITLKENVTSITGVPSWLLVVCRRVLEASGQSDLREVWPNMELFMHGGVSFEPYRKQFKQIIPHSDMRYLEIYNASEGFFAMQDQKEPGEMLLMLDYGIFYEFIPVDQWEEEHPIAIPLSEVEIGKQYAIVISTNAGLWRYKIGDTVVFTSTDPYRIRISGRTKHFINAFGEELIIENAEKALAYACKNCNATIKDYTAAPVYMEEGAGGHEWVIEFDQKPDNLESFANCLDKALKEQNSDYEAKRYNDKVLAPPKIHDARKNLFYDWLKAKDKLGGQNKVPRLSNKRDFIEELLRLN